MTYVVMCTYRWTDKLQDVYLSYYILYLLYYTYQYTVMRRNPVTKIYRYRIIYCEYRCRCAAKANPSNCR